MIIEHVGLMASKRTIEAALPPQGVGLHVKLDRPKHHTGIPGLRNNTQVLDWGLTTTAVTLTTSLEVHGATRRTPLFGGIIVACRNVWMIQLP